MKTHLLAIILTLFLISCSSKTTVNEKRCTSILKNDYRTIVEDRFKSIVGNDTLYLNEIKYECVYSALYIKKGMYDRFGKWHKVIYPNGSRNPILIWNNVKLFPYDTTEFTVAALGNEGGGNIYASVLVFDKQNIDLLSENSEYKAKLINYFSEMIKTNNSNKIDFYEFFWKTFDPKHWEELERYRKNK